MLVFDPCEDAEPFYFFLEPFLGLSPPKLSWGVGGSLRAPFFSDFPPKSPFSRPFFLLPSSVTSPELAMGGLTAACREAKGRD